jgi:peroxiredoxin/GNAT superfamily N-acetyltransferase
MSQSPYTLPPGLPVPVDDGACRHLRNAPVPQITLQSTSGGPVALHRLGGANGLVLFFFPRTGIPGQPPGLGYAGEHWDAIPGARGCTPQSCGYRDLYAEFESLGVAVYGVSTSTPAHQLEFKTRTHAPFDFLSDSELALTRAMDLPTFHFPVESGGPDTLIARMAWYLSPDSLRTLRLRKVWYPVFPADQNAAVVLAWLQRRSRLSVRPASPDDADFVLSELNRHWGGPEIWSLRRPYRADRLPALIADSRGQPVGLLTHTAPGAECEVITLSVVHNAQGIGSRLLEAAADLARDAGCTRIFLTTSNDNMRAIGFYQREGWAMAALHRGNIDAARLLQPHIPRIAANGIPVRDELEFELHLCAGPGAHAAR